MPDWEKRANNRLWSADYLRQMNIPFVAKNNGAHLIVGTPPNVVDFWPGTGKYIFRERDIEGRGVFNLFQDLHQVSH